MPNRQLKIGIITSQNAEQHNADRLERSIKERGHHALKMFADDVDLKIAAEEKVLVHDDVKIHLDSVIIERIPVGEREHFTLLDSINEINIPTLAGTRDAWMNATDKRRTAERFMKHGISSPATKAVTLDNLAEAYDALGPNVWLKVPVSGEGKDVRFASTFQEAIDVVQEFGSVWPHSLVLQEDVGGFDDQGFRRDYRVIVIDEVAVSGHGRMQTDPRKPCNLAQGGSDFGIDFSGDIGTLAWAATAALGLEYGGVDLMHDQNGDLKVLEVNVHPDMAFEDMGYPSFSGLLVDAHIRRAMKNK